MRSHFDKPRLKLWSFGLIFSAEIIALWLGLRYLLSAPEYQPSSKVDDLVPIESPVPVPTYKAVKPQAWNIVNDALEAKIFRPGTLATTVSQKLGEPVWRRPGFWHNSIAWSYENVVVPGFDIGYIFDRQTQKLRQVEIAVPPTTDMEITRFILQSFLEQPVTLQTEAGLEAIHQRSKTDHHFQSGNLTGIIQRNSKDRIYIGVWQTGFH